MRHRTRRWRSSAAWCWWRWCCRCALWASGGAPQAAAFLLAGTAALVLLGLPAAGGGEPAMWFLGLSGVVAATVMVLPGVSGAFVLLVLGPYPYLIGVIRGLTTGDPQLLPLIVFQAGVLIGMGAVSKALSWLLERARGVTLAALSGLMLGSLRRLWPFLAWPDGADADHLPLHAIPQGATLRTGSGSGRRTHNGPACRAGRRRIGRHRGRRRVAASISRARAPGRRPLLNSASDLPACADGPHPSRGLRFPERRV